MICRLIDFTLALTTLKEKCKLLSFNIGHYDPKRNPGNPTLLYDLPETSKKPAKNI